MEAVWPQREVKGSPAAFREPGETDICRGFIVKNNSTLLYFHNVMIKRMVSAGSGTARAHPDLHPSVQPSTVCSHKTSECGQYFKSARRATKRRNLWPQ